MSRDQRDTNVRKKCPFCPKTFVFTCYGSHILKNHKDDLFRRDSQECLSNRKILQQRSSLKEPIALDFGQGDVYACLGCSSIFQKASTAQNHFSKGHCLAKHGENLRALKDLYPLDITTLENQPTLKHKSELETLVQNLIIQLRFAEHRLKEDEPYDYESNYSKFFQDWGMDFNEESLRQDYWFLQPERSKTPPPEETVDQLLPLVQDKPLSKEEFIKATLTAKDIEECSKSVLTGQTKSVPELEQMRSLVSPSTAPPPPPPPPPSDKTSAEEFLKQLDQERKLTPIERFRKANPGASAAELVKMMTTEGFSKPSSSDLKIISNTKASRQN